MRCVPKPVVFMMLAIFVAGCGRPSAVESNRSENPSDAPAGSPTAKTDANTVLTSALSQAGSSGKNVLVHLGAPW